jgi:hypothetical protein
VLLGAVGVVIGLYGLVIIDSRDDVPIGDPPNVDAGTLGVLLIAVAVCLLATAFVWIPFRRSRAHLHREADLRRLHDDSHR